MILAHVIELDPTVAQSNALARACGVARFTYNWALAEWKRQYEAGGKPSAGKLKKQFNALKGTEFPWIYESPRDANSQAFADLGVAFRNFFASCKGQRKGKKIGYPSPRKRGRDDAFYVANDKFHFDGDRVVLPVLGAVKIHERLRLAGKILSGRVRRRADRWFLAIQVDVGDLHRAVPEVRRPIIGVDLGLKSAVVTSAVQAIQAPKPLRKGLRRLRRANQALHRRQKGGRNRHKARRSVARLHLRIADVRKDFWHKVTTNLCRENQAVVIEDLSVRFMVRNRHLSRAASDCALGRFRPLMTYKGPLYQCQVIVADRFYPSTKRCSRCGHVKTEMPLSERVYRCEPCGLVLDRDVNAALNLEAYPRLRGTGGFVPPTPMETCASTRKRASRVAEVGTNPCPHVDTI